MSLVYVVFGISFTPFAHEWFFSRALASWAFIVICVLFNRHIFNFLNTTFMVLKLKGSDNYRGFNQILEFS